MSKLKTAVIIGCTRNSRFGPKPAQWIYDVARQREELDLELIDLKAFDLPLFNEKASNAWMPSEDPRAVAWQNKIGEFDGYIFVVAEYNRSMSGSLKNALDQAYVESIRTSRRHMSVTEASARREPSSICGSSISNCRWSRCARASISAARNSVRFSRAGATSRCRRSRKRFCRRRKTCSTSSSGGARRPRPPRAGPGCRLTRVQPPSSSSRNLETIARSAKMPRGRRTIIAASRTPIATILSAAARASNSG